MKALFEQIVLRRLRAAASHADEWLAEHFQEQNALVNSYDLCIKDGERNQETFNKILQPGNGYASCPNCGRIDILHECRRLFIALRSGSLACIWEHETVRQAWTHGAEVLCMSSGENII
ncbi:hypothetical protein V6C53_17360 [Desulfocurvibacter africanus]|uniref:hypothetical protein n=1 Tax=Desulfocurvibacter africanus TaxID=873 RepID=UPI002FD8BE24